MEKRNSIVLTAIAIATLLVAVVGATFAYFTASVGGTGNTTNNASTVTTAAIAAVDYTTGSNFTLVDAYPGQKGVQVFTVKLTGDIGTKGKYVVKLTPTATNTLLTNVRYTLYQTTTPATNKIEVENAGKVVTGGQFSATDTFKTTGTLTTVGTANTSITNTNVITLDTKEFTITSTATTYTYYLAYEYVNTGADQNTEQNKTFGATVTVELATT